MKKHPEDSEKSLKIFWNFWKFVLQDTDNWYSQYDARVYGQD